MMYQPPRRRRLYLMRHGAVDYFSPDGQPVEDSSQVVLNAAGQAQAQAAGQLLAAHQVKLDRVVTSSLPRTKQTAGLALQSSGHGDMPIEHVEALREIESGELRDVPHAELEESFLGPFRGVPDPRLRYLQGEAIGDFSQRVMNATLHTLAQPDWEVMLMVAHGGVNRVILGYALSAQVTMFSNLLQAPGCINIIDIAPEPRDWIVRAVNLNPSNWLAPDSRSTTVEHMLLQFLRGQSEARQGS